MTDPFAAAHFFTRLVAIFKKLEPERLLDNDVPTLLAKFAGNEGRLWELLRQRYHGRGGPLLDDTVATQSAALRALELSENGITAVGLRALTQACRSNGSLVSLVLSHNNVGDEGAALVASMFQQDCALEDVNLDHNGITDEGFAELLRASRAAPNVVSLSLNGNQLGSVAMAWLVSSSEDLVVDDFELALNDQPAVASPARSFKPSPRALRKMQQQQQQLPTSPILPKPQTQFAQSPPPAAPTQHAPAGWPHHEAQARAPPQRQPYHAPAGWPHS